MIEGKASGFHIKSSCQTAFVISIKNKVIIISAGWVKVKTLLPPSQSSPFSPLNAVVRNAPIFAVLFFKLALLTLL